MVTLVPAEEIKYLKMMQFEENLFISTAKKSNILRRYVKLHCRCCCFLGMLRCFDVIIYYLDKKTESKW